MICKQCNQAFNGAAGICHLCGTDHSEPIIPKAEKIVDWGVTTNPVSATKEEPEVSRPEKKKKGAKP